VKSRGALKRAARAILDGGVVVFPTETVYGLAVRAGSPGALARLRRLKGRPDGKPFQLIVGSVRAFKALCPSLTEEARQLTRTFWPGPLTLVLRSGGRKWVGVRLPDHPVARRLAGLCGGVMVATSANVSGMPPARTAEEAARALGSRVALILDGGPADIGEASTVVKCGKKKVILLREGAISKADIDRAICKQ
jgi:L-threonylcarbamoyladenylate synthase